MVAQNYDIFNRQEKPELTLCTPNKTEQYSLVSASGVSLSLKYNSLSELSFKVYQSVNGVNIPAYSSLFVKKIVKVDGFGYFFIEDVSEKHDAEVPCKHVSAYSYEFALTKKRITAFGGTYPLYDPLDIPNSILGKIINNYAPSWNIGSIDGTLLTKFRTFDVSDTNVYNFLMQDVAEAFGCIFEFNTDTNEISFVAIDNATTQTDVYVSHDNIIISSEFKEIADEITTALYVYGANDLDILTVNPLGTNIIYNFDYYKTSDWMTGGLISALDAWEALVLANQGLYADTLSNLKVLLGELVVLEGELVDLNSDLDSEIGVRKVRIEQGLTEYPEVNNRIGIIESNISNKEVEISNKETEIDSLRNILSGINTALSFENNFTESQLTELDTFIYENTYQNENLEQLDSMDADEVQELAQELYDQAQSILERISQPRYEFAMDTVSVLAIKDYEDFAQGLNLGSLVYAEKADGEVLTLALLEMNLGYDNPSDFSLTFSNRLRLDNGAFIFSDLFGTPVKVGSTVSFDKVKWGDWVNTYKNSVTDFINSSLDASVNSVINATNQEIIIDENGIRGRVYDSDTDSYEPEELWITSKTLAYTDDNWQTAGLALGNISYNGSELFGIVGDMPAHKEIL